MESLTTEQAKAYFDNLEAVNLGGGWDIEYLFKPIMLTLEGYRRVNAEWPDIVESKIKWATIQLGKEPTHTIQLRYETLFLVNHDKDKYNRERPVVLGITQPTKKKKFFTAAESIEYFAREDAWVGFDFLLDMRAKKGLL